MLARVKAIVLDVDGTLCSLNKRVGEIYADLLAEQGIGADASRLSHVARREWDNYQDVYLNRPQQHRTTHAREKDVWCEFVRRVLKGSDLPHAQRPEVIEYIYEAFATRRFRIVAPGAIDFLRGARARGFHVVAATNNDERSKATLRELDLSQHLDEVFVAGDLLWKKPSLAFYQGIEARLALPPSSLLHIGNNADLDVEPALRAGWSAILFGVVPDFKRPPNVKTTSVRDFAQLSALIAE